MEHGKDSRYSVPVNQLVMTLLVFATLSDPTLFFAQAKLSTNNPPNSDQSLKMTKIGEVYLFGRQAAFRTYETPDHIEALVQYGEFRSEQEARLATKQLLKEHRITGKENINDLNGHVISDRIVAAPKQEKKAFMVIRKHGLNYWIIQSISLAVAMQLDGLIEPPPPLTAAAKDRQNPSSCDRSGELLSKQQQLSKEGEKNHQTPQGMVAIKISADGDVVDTTVNSAWSPGAVDVLPSQARSMKFKRRPGGTHYHQQVFRHAVGLLFRLLLSSAELEWNSSS